VNRREWITPNGWYVRTTWTSLDEIDEFIAKRDAEREREGADFMLWSLELIDGATKEGADGKDV